MDAIVEHKPLSELFSELASETGHLFRTELALATVEMTDKAKAAGRDAAIIAVGGGVATLGAMALVGALILAIGTLIPLWVSALLVGISFGAVGGTVAVLGLRAFKAIEGKPRQFFQSLQEDNRWLREEASR